MTRMGTSLVGLRWSVPGVFAVLAVAVLAGPAAAQKSPEIVEKERTLQQTQKQLREERAKAAKAKKREAGLLAELEGIDKRLAQKRRQIQAVDGRIKRAQAEITGLQAEIERLEAQRAGQQQALGGRLRALYKLHSQGGVLPVILSGADPVGQAIRLRHLTTLATVDARLIKEYRVSSEVLGERKGRVEVRRKELSELRAEAEQERAEADREAAKRRTLLARVKDERAYHDRMVGELSEATRRLEAFIKELQARQRRVAKAPPARSRPAPGEESAPGTGFGAVRGRLAWPADGKVIGEYGAQVHPRFGTKTFRNGIDIEVPVGTGIVAVYSGHVVYTGWFRGYGNLIIVDHGGDYYTLYAHAAEIRVSEGEDVKQGQTIGTVGDTGSLQGPRLYFEVRHQGKPQDPTQWLRPRG
jgi:septal ring factor EnvC (AmiA/AmiB activator)